MFKWSQRTIIDETESIEQELECVRTELADFFCEDRDSFKLEECYKLFHAFCQRFRQGILDNEHRLKQEAAADARRKQREEHLALKRRQSSGLFLRIIHSFLAQFVHHPRTNILSNFDLKIPKMLTNFDLKKPNFWQIIVTVIFTSLVRVWASNDTTLQRTIFRAVFFQISFFLNAIALI